MFFFEYHYCSQFLEYYNFIAERTLASRYSLLLLISFSLPYLISINSPLVSEKDIQLQELIYEAIKFGGRLTRTTRSTTSGKKKSPAKKKKKPTKKAKTSDSNNNNNNNNNNNAEGGANSDTSDEDGEEENNTTTTPKKRKNSGQGLTKPVVLSAALAEFLGAEELPRTQVVKKLHDYFKEHNLQNPKDRRKILFDEKLQKVFKSKSTDYFKLNRLISQHVKPKDEIV